MMQDANMISITIEIRKVPFLYTTVCREGHKRQLNNNDGLNDIQDKFNVKASKAMARRRAVQGRAMKSLQEQLLPVLQNNSIAKFAVEMEETVKCELYQMVEKAQQRALYEKK